jgi:hypothetical protein
MKFFYSALIVVGLIGNSVHAMDSQPELVDTVLELVCRHGELDFDFLGLMATVRKHISVFIRAEVAPIVIEREKVLENDYNKRLQEEEFDRGALLTVRKDRLAYGFIGVKVLSEENCAHDEHCRLSLWRVTMRYKPDNVISSSFRSCEIVKTWGDPEPKDKKYPWIENFRNPEQRMLSYASTGNNGFDEISITKPFFTCDNALRVATLEVTRTFQKAIFEKYEYVIADNETFKRAIIIEQ